jgi:hypothetical protein
MRHALLLSRLPGPSWKGLSVRLRGPADDRERGDVPGWVLITVMTAALVTAVWMVAEAKLPGLFSNAVDSVHGSTP